MITDLDIAREIAAGTLPSPTEFMGSTYFAVRFSGTGVAWRPALSEYSFRDPTVWLSSEMRLRVAGVPLIEEHPKGKLNGEEFYRRIVGTLVLGFARDNELWAIARVIDKGAAEIIAGGDYDTSPGVVSGPDSNNSKVTIDGVDQMLIEDEPALFDHLALIDTRGGNAGVWSKGGSADIGVETEGTTK